MKSWYVEYLIMNRFEIVSNPEQDLETYEDLLDVVKAYSVLKKRGIFSDKEIGVLESTPTIKSAGYIMKISKNITPKIFERACSKIGEYLGGYFTNAGYINYMQEKYNLTEQQNYNLQLFMNSKFRFKIMRKQYNA